MNGLMSAGDTLAIVDPNRANPGAKALSVVNTGGTLTGGALAGLNLNPVTGQATAESGKQLFIDQLAQNVKGGVATALIRSAINGGSLEDALKDSLKSAFLNTIAAQTAYEIGNLDGFMNKLAHAIAGCAVGAASAGNGGGCASGAIGAVIGELTAEAMGRRDDTVAVAALMAGLAAAVAGGDASQVNLAASAGSNAAANNYLSHSPYDSVRKLVAEENARLTQECGTNCTQDDFRRIDAQMQKLEAAAQLLETQKRSGLTTDQAMLLGENIAALLPVYGTPIALYQAISGESLSGSDLTAVERLLNGVAAVLPAGTATYRALTNSIADTQWAIAQMNVLREASSGRVLSKGNFTLGEATASQSQILGEAWVGPGSRLASDGTTMVSADGLRQYRPPAAKPNSSYATTGVQANFQGRVSIQTTWTSNGHLNIATSK